VSEVPVGLNSSEDTADKARCPEPLLLYHLNVRHRPALVEERLLRSVEAEPREPALLHRGLNPVRLLTGGHLRAEVNVHRAVGVLAQSLVQ
jgi:hypothetical protein